MKIRASIHKICEKSRLIRRREQIIVIFPKNKKGGPSKTKGPDAQIK